MNKPSFRWSRFALIVSAFAVLGVGGWFAFARENSGNVKARPDAKPAAVSVEVVTPLSGGIDRVCVQPGTLEPFASAELYAKVSGFLVEQKVDIGSVVGEGDILAQIAVPELQKQVQKDTADVRRAGAKITQVTAAITTAKADLGAATAYVAFAKAEQKSKTATRAYREKQRARINELVSKNAIEQKLVDEQEDQYEAAVSAELAAAESVNSATQKEAAAEAKLKQAQADLKFAEAELDVAKAQLEKTETLVRYSVIRSPYNGVVTRRSFHPGDFIKSAENGGERIPLLTIERTDVMRLVIQVPDRDVPYVTVGDPVAVTLDALPGEKFQPAAGTAVVVSRSAESEDPVTRTMRTEVDLKNVNGRLRRGMYGRATLTLNPGAATAVRIPSMALVGKAEGGKATVRVVRGDTVHIVPVQYGTDTGSQVEILSGLTTADQVVVRASGLVEQGTVVTVSEAPAKQTSSH
jgi:RND family efflux transporter MFP subunit